MKKNTIIAVVGGTMAIIGAGAIIRRRNKRKGDNKER